MFSFSSGIDETVSDALYKRSRLGAAVINRDHQVVATNDEMDRINGFKHDGRPVTAAERMPEVVDDIRDHVDAVFLVGEPVFNVRVKGPGEGAARESYLCDYLPAPETPDVEYVVAVVRPARLAPKGRKPMAEGDGAPTSQA
ncbi:MAG: hypothetical protein RKE49_16040 [Oceanicaulis sp.]